jgi:hypothetical protein
MHGAVGGGVMKLFRPRSGGAAGVVYGVKRWYIGEFSSR